jgi:hypothetical protein
MDFTHTIAAFNFLRHIFADDFQQAFFAFVHFALRELQGILTGYLAWIRTKNNAPKGALLPVEPNFFDR